MTRLRVLSLFAGIGGFDLGLERTGGFQTVAFCEIDPFCRRVLVKHWPEVPCYDDVRELTAARLAADGIAVDVICGGFPCQDISCAGSGAGLAGERSGLWSEIARLAGELRPRFVIVENVAALLGRGLGTVLGDLAALGLDAEWHCIPASAVGAHHRRDRVWIVAYPDDARPRDGRAEQGGRAFIGSCGAGLADADREGHRAFDPAGEDTEPTRARESEGHQRQWVWPVAGGSRPPMAYPASIGHPRPGLLTQWCRPEANGAREAAHALAGGIHSEWDAEPDVGRVANGVPDRAHRLRSLGNAVVPQIPELIGNAILASLAQEAA